MARGGAGKNDFFLRFGSDAGEFSSELVADLNRARGVVKLLTTDLKNLDKQSNGSRAKLQGVLAADLAGNGGGGGGGGTQSMPHGGGDPSAFYRDLNSIGSTLRDFNTDLTTTVGKIVAQLGRVPEAAKEYQTSIKRSIAQQIAYRDRLIDENNKITSNPALGIRGAERQQSRTPNLAQAALTGTRAVPAPTAVRVGNTGMISKGFTDVVHKLGEIKDILARGIPVHPGSGGGGGTTQTPPPAPRVGLTTPAATQAAAKVATAKAVTPQAVAAASASEVERLQALDAQMAKDALTIERITKTIAGLSGAVAQEMSGALNDAKAAMEAMKAERAALEREVTGKSRGQQKDERRAGAAAARQALPDQDEEYYNDILRRRTTLDKTSNAAAFTASATGRGKGKLTRPELFEIANELKALGYAPQGINSNSRKEDVAKSILGARGQMDAVHGAGNYPPELALGRKVVAGKISDYMRKLLGELNSAAAKTVEQAQASTLMSEFGRSGGSGYKLDEHGQARVKGNAGLRVSPGLPSQAFGPDALHVTRAAEILDARRAGLQAVGLETAKKNALSRDFNPHDPALYDEISKGNAGDDTAKVAMHALAQLKESTHALDLLGDEFRVFEEQVNQTAKFIKRAESRARRLKDDPDQVGKHPLNEEQYRLATTTDPANIAAAKESMARMRASLNDPKFNGMQELFRSNPYQEGRDARYAQEVANQGRRDAADAKRHFSNANLQEASGAAIFGTRLAPGTSQTYVRNIPGARWNPNLRRTEFTQDREEPQSRLDELNRHHASYNASLDKERAIATHDPDNLAALEKAKAKTENKATAFLNQVSDIFGYSPAIESVIGRKAVDPGNISADDRRAEQRRAVDDRASRKFAKKDDGTILAEREATLAQMLQALTENTKRLSSAKGVLTRAEKKLEASIENEDDASKVARAARLKLADEIGRRARRAQQAEADSDASGGTGRFIPARYKNGKEVEASKWRQGPLMETGTFTSDEERARKAKALELAGRDQLRAISPGITPEEQAVLRAQETVSRRQEGVKYLAGDGKNEVGAIERQRDRLPQSAARLTEKLEKAVTAWDKATGAANRLAAAAGEDTRALLDERKALLARRDSLYETIRAGKTGRPEGQQGPLNQYGDFSGTAPRTQAAQEINELQKRLAEINTQGPVRQVAEKEGLAGKAEAQVRNIEKQINALSGQEEKNVKVRAQATSKEATSLRKRLAAAEKLKAQETELAQQLAELNKGVKADYATSRAPVTKGSRGLFEAAGRPGAKPILERGKGQWAKDLEGMEPAKIDSIMKDIGSSMTRGTHSVKALATELNRWQRGAKQIGEVDANKKLTKFEPEDPRYGRATGRLGQDPLANLLHRLSNSELDHRVRPEGSSGAPAGVRGIKDFLGSDDVAEKAADAYTKHLGKGMPAAMQGQLREFVKAAGRFVAGKGHHEGVDDPEFDILRDMAKKAPTVDQPLYRGLRSPKGPRFDENGMLLGSTQKLASWTSDKTTAGMFGQHQLKMVGGQALNLGSMGGMEEYLAQGQYKLKRQYADPTDKSGKRIIYEVEQLLDQKQGARPQAANVVREQLAALREKGVPSKAEISKMRAELHALDQAGGGGGGKGGGGRTAAGGDDEGPGKGGNSILRQILAELKAFHSSVKRGVPTRGKAGTTEAGAEGGERLTKDERRKLEVNQSRSGDAEQEALAAAAQRRRLKFVTKESIDKPGGSYDQAVEEDASRQKRSQREIRRSTEATREQARSKQLLEGALKSLDSDSRRELDNLRALHKAGTDEEQITLAQARAYAALDKAMAKQGVRPAGARQQQIRAVLSDAGPKVSGTETQSIARQARSINGFQTVDKAMASQVQPGGIFGEQSVFTKAMFGNTGFWSRVMASTGTFVVRNFTAGFVFGLTNALQEIVRQGIITESTFIRVSDALEQTGRSSGNLRTQLQGISSQYGTNLEDVYQTAAGLVGLFDSVDDIAGATKVVSQLQSISMGALNAQEAMGVLASITGAYGDQLEGGVDGLGQIADVLTVIQNVIGTNVEVTSEGVGRMSGLSRQLKIDFQDTAVYVAQIAKLTNQSGGAAGEQFSRILASMQSGRGRAVLTDQRSGLKGTGIEELLGSGQYGEALKVLMKNWDGLSDSQKRNITTTLAGQRQAAAFAALMNNSTKVLDAQAQAHNANGQAAQRAANIAKTLNGQIQRLTSNLQNLAQNLVRTGLLNFFGVLLKVTNAALSGINHLFSMFNDVADSNPALKMLKDFTGLLLGLIVTLKLGGMAFRGFKASLTGLRAGEGALSQGVNAAMGGTGVAGGVGGVILSPAERQQQLDDERNARYRQRELRAQRPSFLSGVAGSPYGGAAFFDQRAENLRERADDPIRGSEARQRRMAGLYGSTARASNLAATGLRKVGSGMSALSALGGGAQLGIGLAVAAITAGLMDLKKGSDQAKEARKLIEDQYNEDGSVKKDADRPYQGPLTQKAKEIREDNSGFTAGLGMALGSQLSPKYGLNLLKERYSSVAALTTGHINKQTLGGLVGLGTSSNYIAGRQGVLPKEDQKALSKYIDDTITRVDDVDTSKPNAWRETFAGNLPKGLRRKALRDTRPKQLTYEEAIQLSNDVGTSIEDTRAEIEKSKMTDQQKLGAQAQLEQLARDVNERIAKMILVAQGVANIDMLSAEQLAAVDQTQSTFASLGTSGGSGAVGRGAGGLYGKMYDQLIADTGARPDSKIGKNLEKLSKGSLSKTKAFTLQGKVLDDEIQQLQAQYLAATTSNEKGLEPEEIDALKTQMLAAINQRAALVQQRLDAFAEEGNALSAAAAAGGNYTLAGDIAGAYAGKFHRHRDIANENDVQRATNDQTERGMAENQANQIAASKNKQLEASKASTFNTQQSSNIDVQITKNAYDAMLAAQKSAQEAGRQGPAIDSIAQARNAYFGALKSQQQMMDQIAQATRQTAIAAIPQGDAVRVARAQVANARASVAEARKYGVASTEYQGALAQLYSAQQQAMSAQGAVRSAQAQLAVAYAEARGDTVAAAHASERVARVGLANARKSSGGKNSAEVLAARAQVVQARAATRDAILNDRLETIDFNLEMGKTTQSSAIAAMQQILRTANLTKQQRRDLLLKIKGMKDEIADGPWNFGSVDLPTPYQMRRYVSAERMNAAQKSQVPYHDSTSLQLQDRPSRGGEPGSISDNRTVLINGADTAKVRKILEEILGKSVKTRTAQGRRR